MHRVCNIDALVLEPACGFLYRAEFTSKHWYMGLQDCGAPTEAVYHSSCSTGQCLWRGGSSASSSGEHSGQFATSPRAAAGHPTIVGSSFEEVNEQRQRTTWTSGSEDPGRQQAAASTSLCSSATPASPSRSLKWRECWPGSGISSHEAAAGRSVCLSQLLHVFHAECKGKTASRPIHRLRRGACRRGQDEGRHQDQDEALLHKAKGHRAVATKLGIQDLPCFLWHEMHIGSTSVAALCDQCIAISSLRSIGHLKTWLVLRQMPLQAIRHCQSS